MHWSFFFVPEPKAGDLSSAVNGSKYGGHGRRSWIGPSTSTPGKCGDLNSAVNGSKHVGLRAVAVEWSKLFDPWPNAGDLFSCELVQIVLDVGHTIWSNQ